MKNRKQWLDIARGICIICMVCCHSFDWSKRNYEFIRITGTWFLVFFFFCSGLCFSNKYSFKEHLVRQAKKLLLPYFIVVISYLTYRIYQGMWWDISTPMKTKFFLASLFTALPSEFQDVPIFRVRTIGIGPIWFFVCMFGASIIYKLLYRFKYKLAICFVLSGLAAYSQKYIVLPLNIQNACIGCLFIAFGDALKAYVFKFVMWIKRLPFFWATTLCVAAFHIYFFVLITAPYQIINLGGNAYSLYSLCSSFTGFLFLILLAVLFERVGILDDFLSYCGRESLCIVIIHNIDILMVRNWTMQGYSFLIGTLLLYPFIVYNYRKLQETIHSKFALQKN